MTLVEYTFIRFFHLRRKLFGITPSEVMKAVGLIVYLDYMWIMSLTLTVDLLTDHFVFDNFHIFFFVFVALGLLSLFGRCWQLESDKAFASIERKYKHKKLNRKKWDIASCIYVAVTFLTFITCCVVAYLSG